MSRECHAGGRGGAHRDTSAARRQRRASPGAAASRRRFESGGRRRIRRARGWRQSCEGEGENHQPSAEVEATRPSPAQSGGKTARALELDQGEPGSGEAVHVGRTALDSIVERRKSEATERQVLISFSQSVDMERATERELGGSGSEEACAPVLEVDVEPAGLVHIFCDAKARVSATGSSGLSEREANGRSSSSESCLAAASSCSSAVRGCRRRRSSQRHRPVSGHRA